MNKSSAWLIALLAGWVTAAQAQISVEIRTEQDQFLPAETIRLAVRITNRSGQTMTLGNEANWLTFTVEAPGSGVVAKLAEVPVLGEFELPSSKVATKWVDIAPYFQLENPGHYTVTATVRVKQWAMERTSAPKSFNVIEGARLWEQDFGVSGRVDPNTGAPEIRRYIVQQANYVKGQLRLYVRVWDPETGKTFKVIPVGRTLTFSRPQAQIDHESNLHLIYQNGPGSFLYTKFDPEGELLLRQTHDIQLTRPRLQVAANREVVVQGGVRRILASDIPAPNPESLGQSSEQPEPVLPED